MASLPHQDFDATRPSSLEEAPFHRAAPAVPGLRLRVKGFSPMEQRLLQATVKLSQRGLPRLDLLEDAAAESADIVMIDARDPESMQWARRQAWLARKAVIWVDATAAPQGHTAVRRPVQWPILPMLLAGVLEHGPRQGERSGSHRRSHCGGRGVDPRHLVDASGSHCRRQPGGPRASALAARSARHRRDTGGCILMDVLMPGIDGYEACRRIKASPSVSARRS